MLVQADDSISVFSPLLSLEIYIQDPYAPFVAVQYGADGPDQVLKLWS